MNNYYAKQFYGLVGYVTLKV